MNYRIVLFLSASILANELTHADDTEALLRIEKSGAAVQRDDTKSDKPVICIQLNLRQITADTNLAISEISFLPKIEFIGSGDTEVKSETLQALHGKTSLKEIVISNAKISDEAANVLGTLNGLESLTLRSQVEMSLRGREVIFRLTSLKELMLSDRLVSDFVIEKLVKLPNLKILTLRSVFLTDEGIMALGKVTNLRTLRILIGSRVSEAGIGKLVEFQVPEIELTYLDVTDIKLKDLRKFSGLKVLRFINAGKVTDDGIPFLAELTELKELDLSDARLTMTGIKELKRALPKCHVIYDARKRD